MGNREGRGGSLARFKHLDIGLLADVKDNHLYFRLDFTGGSIATIHVRDDEKGPHPVSNWARKQQAEENLARLASLVTHGHA